MRCIGIERCGGKIVLVVESRFLWMRKITRYHAVKQYYVTGHYKWLKLPDNIVVYDAMSFQLDAWLERMETDIG